MYIFLATRLRRGAIFGAIMATLGGCREDHTQQKKTDNGFEFDKVHLFQESGIAHADFELGSGYDEDQKFRVRGLCLKETAGETIPFPSAQGIERITVSQTRVESHEDLLRELNISGQAAGQYGLWGGNARMAKFEKFTASKDDLTWVVRIETKMGRKVLKRQNFGVANFADDVQQLILRSRAGDAEARKEFRERCGTHVVTGYTLGGQIYQAVQITNRSSELIKKMSASISGGGSSGIFKLSGSLKMDDYLKNAQTMSALRSETDQVGGSRVNLNITPENVEEITQQFVDSLRGTEGVRLDVELNEWSTIIGLTPAPTPEGFARGVILERVARLIHRAKVDLGRIDAMTYWYNDGQIELTPEELRGLEKSAEDLSDFLREVVEKGQTAFESRIDLDLKPIQVALPEVRRKVRKTTITMGPWSFEYPAFTTRLDLDGNPFEYAGWVAGEPLASTYANGEPASVLVRADANACPGPQLPLPNSLQPLFSATGLRIEVYRQLFSERPEAKPTWVLFTHKSGYCLSVIASEIRRDFDIRDGSALAARLVGLASSINSNQ